MKEAYLVRPEDFEESNNGNSYRITHIPSSCTGKGNSQREAMGNLIQSTSFQKWILEEKSRCENVTEESIKQENAILYASVLNHDETAR